MYFEDDFLDFLCHFSCHAYCSLTKEYGQFAHKKLKKLIAKRLGFKDLGK